MMFGLILPWYARWVALGLAMLAAAAFGAFRMHEHDRKDYDKLHGEFEVFKDKVTALGMQAKKDAKAKEALDLKRKDAANHENALALTNLADTVAKLRNKRDSGRSIVPPAPAASKCPNGQACFDRAELERALRDYRSEIRQLVDEGSAVTVDLNTAKKWAKP